MKQKALKSFNQNNKINNKFEEDNGIELREEDEGNDADDSSTRLADLKPIEISTPSNNSK